MLPCIVIITNVISDDESTAVTVPTLNAIGGPDASGCVNAKETVGVEGSALDNTKFNVESGERSNAASAMVVDIGIRVDVFRLRVRGSEIAQRVGCRHYSQGSTI